MPPQPGYSLGTRAGLARGLAAEVTLIARAPSTRCKRPVASFPLKTAVAAQCLTNPSYFPDQLRLKH